MEVPLNTLKQRINNLAQTHHEPLLQAIQTTLQKQNPFTWRKSDGRFTLDADGIARAVMAAGSRWREAELLTPAPQSNARASTLPVTPEEAQATRTWLHKIQSQLSKQFEEAALARGLSPQQLATRLTGDIQQTLPFGVLADEAPDELARSFKAGRKRLTFHRPEHLFGAPISALTNRKPLLRWHKLTLTIHTPKEVTQQLADAIRNRLSSRFDPTELDELDDLLKEQVALPHSDLNRHTHIIATEIVGQLKKEATLQYLAFLSNQMDGKNTSHPALREMLRRLRELQDYLRREDKADTDYEVTYEGQRTNLRTLFAQENAFEDLPVFPLVDGAVGEVSNPKDGSHSYIFGMKLKLNGKVASLKVSSSFEYHLRLLRKEIKTRPERLVRLAVLYFVVFSNYADPTYDPIAALEQHVLPILQSDTTTSAGQQGVDRLLAQVAEQCKTAPVLKFAADLRHVLKQTTIAAPQSQQVSIRLREGIIETNPATILDEKKILKNVLSPNRKEYLAYFEVGEPAVTGQALFSLQAEIAFEDIQCFDTDGTVETCAIQYDAKGKKLLPVFLTATPGLPNPTEFTQTPTPTIKAGVRIPCMTQTSYKGSVIDIHKTSPLQWFVYRYTFSLIAYLGLQLLASYQQEPVFISIARMHQISEDEGENEDPEAFIAMVGKVAAHLLSADYVANSQGLQQSADVYRKRNAATSLYSVLPKTFSFQQELPEGLPHLALVIVSSRESDSVHQSKEEDPARLSTVYGEVIEFERQDNKTIRIQRTKTFSETYPSQELYTNPTVVLDQIHQLYQRGHRDIFYIAQAPYSSTLHITRLPEDSSTMDPQSEGLYFLSREIIKRCMQEKPELHIYPVFRDQYHAMKIVELNADTLYIQDLAELMRVVDDQSQQMAVFLNLFSGQQMIGSKDGVDKYNGVVSYATLLNIYGNLLNERHLRAALIHDEGGKNTLKNLLVLYLTLFHLSRYEAHKNKIAIKINPYSTIIGDESIGARASQSHVNPYVRFNFLAFLTEVRTAIMAVQGK